MADGPNLPFGPVVEYAKALNDRHLGELIGFSMKWAQRHRSMDLPLTLHQAETCAEHLQVHPLLLWPVEYPRVVAQVGGEEDAR